MNIMEDNIITRKEVLETEFLPAKKRTWIWSDDFYLNDMNPKYGYYCWATLHIPTEIWRKGKSADISTKMSKIILHRYYNVEDPMSSWDWSFENGESEVVYKGNVRDGAHLEELLISTGIKDK